jgi:hypothetical protein
MKITRPAHWLRLIVAAYLILAAIYSVATPIFEASDEVWHFPVVQHLKTTGQLPVQQPGVVTTWQQEGSQPPLYYALMALAISPIDTSDFPDRLYANPHAVPGDPSLDANRNLVIHSPAENFPWRNTTLAVHLIRFFSILMGAGTIVLSYLIARRIFHDRPAIPIGTAALIAFNPMFIFISASVNNDNLTILLASLALYLSVVCWYEPPGRVNRSGWGRRLLLGIVLGGAALSKVSGLTLLPIVALLLTVRHLRRHEWREWIFTGILIALPVIVIAGWWYLRNLQLYGELLGLDTMVAIAGTRSVSPIDLVPEFDGFRYSYWALLGAVNIVTFPLAYVIFDLFTLLSAGGGIVWFWRNRRSDQFWLLLILLGYVLIVFIGVVRWTMMTPASQGRLMFPAISVISLLLWLGWESILDFAVRAFGGLWIVNFTRLRWAMPIFMLIIAAVVPFRDIAPAYAGPQLMTEQQLPSDLKRLEVDYGDQLRLVGYRLAEPLARTDSVEFTLYWQCLQPAATDDSIFVIVYGRQLQELGKRDAYPYHGLYATSQCPPGQVFADPYRIPIKTGNADRPTILRTQIGVKEWVSNTELQPTANGATAPAVMLTTGKLASEWLIANDVRLDYRVSEHIRLLDASIQRGDDEGKLVLRWQATGNPPENYMTFVHILDANGKMIGQADGPTLNGDYPTNWWSPNEIVVDERPLPLPPGADRVTIGLYRLSDQTRLPVLDPAGQRVPNDEIVLPVQP